MDAVSDYSLTQKIIANAQWNPSIKSLSMSEYTYYPITDFLYGTTSMLTGIPLLFVVKYLFVIKGLMIPPLIEKWLRSFFGNRIAFLGTALFLSSPGAILWPHKETFAIIFFF